LKPLISIIIPAYNDPTGLRDTLNSVVTQTFTRSLYEIIGVDNNSHDNTLNIANEFKKQYPDLIKILVADKVQSSYAARNRGIKSSQGFILAFIDSDMIVDKDYLSKIQKLMQSNNNEYVGCDVEIFMKRKTVAGLYNKIIGFTVEGRIKSKHYAPTCCLIIRRQVIEKIGLFDSRSLSENRY
jgi:glycosyltransferase AglI